MSCSRGCCSSQSDHYRSVVVRPTVSAERAQERAETADMAAYARLRKDGVQPKAIEGAALLEREAGSVVEIERGHIVRNDRLRREWQQAHNDLSPPPSPPPAVA